MSSGVGFAVFNLPDGPKDEVLLLPYGQHTTVDGQVQFNFAPEDAKNVIEFFKSRGIGLLFDWEHQSIAHLPGFEQFKSPDGRAPAAAWGGDLVAGEQGLIAKNMQWTQEAADAIKSGQYRYQSPVLIMHPQTRRVQAIQSVGLTNEPRLKGVPALAARSDLGELLISFGKDSNMSLKDALVGALGLKTDAADQEILSTVGTLRDKAAIAETANGQVTAFKTQATEATTKVTQLEATIATLTADKTKLDGDVTAFKTQMQTHKAALADVVLSFAEETGRITPAGKATWKPIVEADPVAALTAFKSTPAGSAVPVGRTTTTGSPATTTAADHPLTALKSQGIEVDPKRVELAGKVRSYMAEHKVDYPTALQAVESAAK